jgi:hypothetical protein
MKRLVRSHLEAYLAFDTAWNPSLGVSGNYLL